MTEDIYRTSAPSQSSNETYLMESYLASTRLTSSSGTVVRLDVVLEDDPGSLESLEKIKSIRQALGQFNSYPIGEIVVGGDTAIQYDTKSANNRDIKTVAPIVLLIIFLVLVILLKAIVAPLYLFPKYTRAFRCREWRTYIYVCFLSSSGSRLQYLHHFQGQGGSRNPRYKRWNQESDNQYGRSYHFCRNNSCWNLYCVNNFTTKRHIPTRICCCFRCTNWYLLYKRLHGPIFRNAFGSVELVAFYFG